MRPTEPSVAEPSASPTTPVTGPPRSFHRFVILWAGQFASLIGSNLTGFALAVYVYRLTDSVTVLGLVFALGLAPAVVVSPLAGPLVDRWGPRRTLLISNVGNLMITTALAAVLVTGTFVVWHVYVVVTLGSVLSAFEIPAFAALTPRVVPTARLGQANGLRMVALATSQVLAPVLAGFLLLAIDIAGIVVIDFVSFALAIVTLLLVKLPAPRASLASATADPVRRSLLSEFGDGLRYVTARRGLLMLAVFVAAMNFSSGFIELLITPLVLAFASPGQLGIVMSVSGLGMVVSGVAVSIWGGPRHRVAGVLGCSLLLGLACMAGSLRPDLILVAVAGFCFLGALGVIVSSSQVIWQTKVEPSLLGRVMALVNMVSLVPQLIANVLAGILVDRVFEPFVGRDDVRSPALVLVVGDGPGRGIALLLLLVGVGTVVIVGLASASPRLRHLELELPDVADPDDEQDPDTELATEPDIEPDTEPPSEADHRTDAAARSVGTAS